MGEWFASIAGGGSLVLALPIALTAGLVSFFSPCVLPLLPAYLSYASGISGSELVSGELERGQHGRLVVGTMLFVSGFATVFVLLGVVAGGIGAQLATFTRGGTTVLAVILIGLGLLFLGWFPRWQRTIKFSWRPRVGPQVGIAAAPVLGFLFGLGWTPCTGPTLGAIFLLATGEETALRGGILSAGYAVGLGLPFVIAALAYSRASAAFRGMRRYARPIQVFGGAMLIVIGLAMLTGWWDYAVGWLRLALIERSFTPV
jgi:cytochrome c-type biogenesis protein